MCGRGCLDASARCLDAAGLLGTHTEEIGRPRSEDICTSRQIHYLAIRERAGTLVWTFNQLSEQHESFVRFLPNLRNSE